MRQRAEGGRVLAHRQWWPETTRALITGRYPLDAYRDLLLGQPGGIKNVLAFGGAPGTQGGPAALTTSDTTAG